MNKLLLAVLLLAPAVAAAAASDPIAAFHALPAPPKTMQQAAASVKLEKGRHAHLAAPAYDAAMSRLHRAVADAGTAAGQQQMDDAGMGVDVQRLQNDPKYAAQFRARMRAMSPAEQMALAQRMQNGSRARALREAKAQRVARGKAVASLGESSKANSEGAVALAKMFDAALKDSADRHAAVDAQFSAQIKGCPTDRIGLPLPSCSAPLGRKAIAQHKAVEAKCLADENAVYAKAYALARENVDALAPTQQAARDGGNKADLSAVEATIDGYSSQLLAFAKTMAVRAGYWSQPVEWRWTGELGYWIKTSPENGLFWPPAVTEEK